MTFNKKFRIIRTRNGIRLKPKVVIRKAKTLGNLFVLIKRKGSKKFHGVIPSRKGSTVKGIRMSLLKKGRGGFAFKIVNMQQLKKVIMLQDIRKRRS